MSKYPLHPVAELFPRMSKDEFAALKQSIREFGQCEPATLWKGQLIDGRHRVDACNELKIEPEYCELDEHHDPLQYVLKHNLHRRHLSETQKAVVAAGIANMKRGRPSEKDKPPIGGIKSSVKEAAAIVNTSPRSVERAKSVMSKAAPEVVEAMKSDDITLHAAEQLTKSVPDKNAQAKIVAGGKKAVAEAVKPVNKAAKPVKPKPPAVEPIESAIEEQVSLPSLQGPELEWSDKRFISQFSDGFAVVKDRLNVIWYMFDAMKLRKAEIREVKKWLAKDE